MGCGNYSAVSSRASANANRTRRTCLLEPIPLTTQKAIGNMLLTMASHWQVFCFITHRGENIICEWLKKEKVPRTQVAMFQAKLDTFERGGPDLSPGLISSGPVGKDIFKMKIKGHKGHMQLRP